MKNTRQRVLLTGGHAATTALATIESLHEDRDQWELYWIGPHRALEGTRFKPFELDLFPRLGVHVYSIVAGKLQSKFTRYTIPSLLKLPVGFGQALYYVSTIRPRVVVSFGGFASVPVVVAAWILRIPVIVHEQTVAAGLANRISGIFATKIALARQESSTFYSKKKTVVVGNPLLKEIMQVPAKKKIHALPTIYVTGGSRGSQRLNKLIFESLSWILKDYKVIHQTGALDLPLAQEVRSNLPDALQKRYAATDFINPLKVYEMYDAADIVIGRSGANTVSEVLALGIPTLFIPIPWTRGDEQNKNAHYAKDRGIALVLSEAKMNAETLAAALTFLRKNWSKMVAIPKNDIDTEASTRLKNLIFQLA